MYPAINNSIIAILPMVIFGLISTRFAELLTLWSQPHTHFRKYVYSIVISCLTCLLNPGSEFNRQVIDK